jgi:L-threonylcarbamoyladenylate synthase
MNPTRLIPATQPDAVEQALLILRGGGLVAFPTDTVYGVGALAFDGAAVESIYAAKDRPIEKAIPVLIADLADLDKVAVEIPAMARILAVHFWPGPLTLIVPKKPGLPEAVSATDTVAVRIPDHPVARALLRAAGPMAVTSANLSGQASPTNAEEVMHQLGGRIPLVIDGGVTPGGIPSTLVDCLGADPVILREGPLTKAQILSALT